MPQGAAGLSLRAQSKSKIFEHRYLAQASLRWFSSWRLCRELIESENCESGLPGFKSWFCHSLDSYLTSVDLFPYLQSGSEVTCLSTGLP